MPEGVALDRGRRREDRPVGVAQGLVGVREEPDSEGGHEEAHRDAEVVHAVVLDRGSREDQSLEHQGRTDEDDHEQGRERSEGVRVQHQDVDHRGHDHGREEDEVEPDGTEVLQADPVVGEQEPSEQVHRDAVAEPARGGHGDVQQHAAGPHEDDDHAIGERVAERRGHPIRVGLPVGPREHAEDDQAERDEAEIGEGVTGLLDRPEAEALTELLVELLRDGASGHLLLQPVQMVDLLDGVLVSALRQVADLLQLRGVGVVRVGGGEEPLEDAARRVGEHGRRRLALPHGEGRHEHEGQRDGAEGEPERQHPPVRLGGFPLTGQAGSAEHVAGPHVHRVLTGRRSHRVDPEEPVGDQRTQHVAQAPAPGEIGHAILLEIGVAGDRAVSMAHADVVGLAPPGDGLHLVVVRHDVAFLRAQDVRASRHRPVVRPFLGSVMAPEAAGALEAVALAEVGQLEVAGAEAHLGPAFVGEGEAGPSGEGAEQRAAQDREHEGSGARWLPGRHQDHRGQDTGHRRAHEGRSPDVRARHAEARVVVDLPFLASAWQVPEREGRPDAAHRAHPVGVRGREAEGGGQEVGGEEHREERGRRDDGRGADTFPEDDPAQIPEERRPDGGDRQRGHASSDGSDQDGQHGGRAAGQPQDVPHDEPGRLVRPEHGAERASGPRRRGRAAVTAQALAAFGPGQVLVEASQLGSEHDVGEGRLAFLHLDPVLEDDLGAAQGPHAVGHVLVAGLLDRHRVGRRPQVGQQHLPVQTRGFLEQPLDLHLDPLEAGVGGVLPFGGRVPADRVLPHDHFDLAVGTDGADAGRSAGHCAREDITEREAPDAIPYRRERALRGEALRSRHRVTASRILAMGCGTPG